MASPSQTKYIQDLAVIKTKEFKEVKELLFANQIVDAGSDTVALATTLADICNALTDLQASKLIDVLVAAKEPARSKVYAPKRVHSTVAGLDGIIATVDDWGFDGLQ